VRRVRRRSPGFASDPQAEWATEYCWWPDDRYVSVPGLASEPDEHYTDVLKRAATLVRALEPLSVPGVHVAAVGFDDGDFILI
jgi:hypothetical protein